MIPAKTTAKTDARPIPRRNFSDREFDRARQPEFLWCIHCERAYQFGDFRRSGTRQLCPYVSCAGASVFAWDWAKVRLANPSYPAEPSQGVVYPLFGKGIYTRA